MIYQKFDKKYKIIYQLNNKIITIILTEPEYLTLDLLLNPKADIISVEEIKKKKFDFLIYQDYSYEVSIFFNELASMLKSNLMLFDALESLYYNTKNEIIKNMIAQLLDALNQGESLYPTIKRFKRILGFWVIEFIRISQTTGTLKESIIAIADIKTKEYRYKQKIKSAFSYPILLIITIFIALNLILFFVVPKFKVLFANVSNIPLPTQIIFFISDNILWFILGSFIVIYLLKLYYSKSSKFNIKDIDTSSLPIIGSIIYYNNLTNFFLNIYLLIQAKYNIDISIKYSLLSIQNKIIKKKVYKILKFLYNGDTLSKAFEKSELFDDVVLKMINNIEKSSDTQNTFYKLFLMFEEKQNTTIEKTIKLIEPVIIVFFATFILFLALAIFLPLWDVNQFK